MLEWEEYFEPHILERGRSYARRGAVKYISRHEDTIEAIVEGTEYYAAIVYWIIDPANRRIYTGTPFFTPFETASVITYNRL